MIHPDDMKAVAAQHAKAQEAIKASAEIIIEHAQNEAYRAGYERGAENLAAVAVALAVARDWMRAAPPEVLEQIDAALEAAGVEPCAATMAA